MMTSRGFTLVETMVAIAIVAITIIGPLYALQQGVVASYAARDRLVASALAQEGLEFVRGVRDSNYLYNLALPASPHSWFYGMDGTDGSPNCTVSAKCTVDTTRNLVTLCSGSCPALNISSTDLYNHAPVSSSNTASRFTRTVTITPINSREMQVSVTMSWVTAKIPYTMTISEHMQNWL